MRYRRILAIDLTSRGFGFVIVEAGQPIDWGTTDVRTSALLERVSELVKRLRPSVLLVEDYAAADCPRCERVKHLLGVIERQVIAAGTTVHRISNKVVATTFAGLGATNKHKRASLVALRFPDLAPRLPRERKPWTSEDERMGIFDAAALIICFLHEDKRIRRDLAAGGK